MNRTDLQRLSRIRLVEARALLAAKRYEGAYYLAGYAVECAFKACIAKQVKKHDFPNKQLANASYTHNLEELLSLSNLKPLHSQEFDTNQDFKLNWLVVKDWNESSRYSSKSKAEAKDLYSAITARKNGILGWLKKHW